MERRIGGARADSGSCAWHLIEAGHKVLKLKLPDGILNNSRDRIYEPAENNLKSEDNSKKMNVSNFISIANKYTSLSDLTPTVVMN